MWVAFIQLYLTKSIICWALLFTHLDSEKYTWQKIKIIYWVHRIVIIQNTWKKDKLYLQYHFAHSTFVDKHYSIRTLRRSFILGTEQFSIFHQCSKFTACFLRKIWKKCLQKPYHSKFYLLRIVLFHNHYPLCMEDIHSTWYRLYK